MHGVMRGVCHPWLLVDHRQAPAVMSLAGEMIEPRHRAIVDGESEPSLRLVAERQSDRRLDRSAMRYRDDILACMFEVDPLDRTAHAIVEIHEALAAGCRIIDRCKPVAAHL